MRILYLAATGRILEVVRDADWPTFNPSINIAYQTLYIDEIPPNKADLQLMLTSLILAPPPLPPRIPWTVSGTTLVRSDATVWTPAVNEDRADTDNNSLYTTAQDWLQTIIDDGSFTNTERDLYIRRLATIQKRLLRFLVRKHRAE